MKIDNNKIERLIELQLKFNREMEMYGRASDSIFSELMDVDNELNEAEQEEFENKYVEILYNQRIAQ
jgi:hypothetical protein